MKFPGELKFPDLDHPGVPVQFLVEGNQAELTLEGESLGRWSLYDVRADRLIASAFQVDLAGSEITFVADDPIDFAYRGVEHMAKTWAVIKAKRLGARGIAINRSRRDTIPSRIAEVRAAMEVNLGAEQRQLAGEPAMPPPVTGGSPAITSEETAPTDWDRRDQAGEIPAIGATPRPAPPPSPGADPFPGGPSDHERGLEEERRLLEQERAELERQRAEAEQREANLFEAYRLEMERLEAEREELRRSAAEAAEHVETTGEAPQPVTTGDQVAEPMATTEPGPELELEPEPVAELEPDLEPEPEPEPEPEQVAAEGRSVLDLNEYEDGRGGEPSSPPMAPAAKPPTPRPEPAMAGATKERAGLMGAVRAAFRGGAKDHDHHFIEAPGGIGITRYVCEECGYVSIAVGS